MKYNSISEFVGMMDVRDKSFKDKKNDKWTDVIND